MNITDVSALRKCTSCQLCGAVCPKSAIEIVIDNEGFYRPHLNTDKCVNCGICKKICYKFDSKISMTSNHQLQNHPIYAAWAKDSSVISSTTSGGIADLLARQLIADGYHVVGVVYDDNMQAAKHVIASTAEETLPFRGSKYIQSFTFDAFKQIVKTAKDTKYAVFGTPCQIYAIYKLATIFGNRDNFIFIDLYCHGCPSKLIWNKYQSYIKQKLKIDRFDKVIFRSKVKGWGGFYVVVVVVDGKVVFKSNPKEDGFYELFFSDQVLNDGCNDCLLRSTLEYTDIRLGDFWGKKFLSNQKGVSAISIASEKGAALFEEIANSIACEKCNYTEFLPYQSWGKTHLPNETTRKAVFSSLQSDELTIFDAVKSYRKYQTVKGKFKRHIKTILYYLPLSVTNCLKRFLP
ncbi:MAG: Coenzyme F420 hydrogenase/dehydrogenase, beta subunit C-terminal domain [Muribaculaceae bacterium]